jgi:UDP-N-acetylmuramate dehydrogenase
LRAAAGESWHGLVLWSLKQGHTGLENLSLIPGNVGAAPIQNIGAYGVELKDRFHTLDAVALADGSAQTFTHEACEFGYRTSLFKVRSQQQYLITSVTLRLPREPDYQISYRGVKEALAAQPQGTLNAVGISQAICAIRRAKLPDPKQLGNAGSFFKNPTVTEKQFDQLRSRHGEIPGFPLPNGGHKLSAASLIERCGWKGYRRGDAGVSQNHALVLVNHGAATGQQIWQLAQDIGDSVGQTFGVTLEPEVTVI